MAKSLNELPLKEPDTGWDYADPSNFAGIRETFNVDTVCSATPADVSWIFGYKGKLVRDNIHSLDVARFIEEFWKEPRIGETYNLGGGRANSVSILEAFEFAAAVSGKKQVYKYVDKNREGDHFCYISDLAKCRVHYPTVSLGKMFEEIHQSWATRQL
jgi:CDP-paratose 2-epimerase